MTKNNKYKEDWIECELGEISLIERGGSPRPIKDYLTNGDGVNWIKIGDATNSGKYILETEQKIKPSGLIKSREVFPGDVLLSNSMSFGRPYIMGINGAIHDGWLVIRSNKYINKDFLYYLLSSPYVFQQFSRNAKGSTVKNLNIKIVSDVTVKIPPLPIQHTIVKKIEELFSSLDSGIADLKKAQEQLKIYRQAVLKKAFEGGLTNTVFKKVLVEEIGNIQTGNTPSKKVEDFYNYRDYNFYKPSDLDKGLNINTSEDFLSINGFENARQAPKNSILVTCIGATIGKTGLIKKEGGFNQQINAIIPNDKYLSEFIYYQVISMGFQTQIKTNASSTTLPILNKSKFSKLEMVSCPLPEQYQIVKEIESRLSVCDAVEKSIEESLLKAESLRQSILKQAFEGKLLSEEEIKKCKEHPDYEPASKLLEKIMNYKL